jgi:hypothetical protein
MAKSCVYLLVRSIYFCRIGETDVNSYTLSRPDWAVFCGIIADRQYHVKGLIEKFVNMLRVSVSRCFPNSLMAWRALGCTAEAGLVPALTACQVSPRRALMMASAIWLRAEFPVQRTRMFRFIFCFQPVVSEIQSCNRWSIWSRTSRNFASFSSSLPVNSTGSSKSQR